MTVLIFLLILILLTFPLGEMLRLDVGNNIAIKPLDVLVVVAALIAAVLFVFKKIKFSQTHLTKPLIAFSAISLLSLIINFNNLSSNHAFTAFLYWVRFASYAVVYYVIVTIDKHSIKIAKKLLLVSGTIFIFLGFIQYFLYANLRNLYYLGWDEHNYRLFSTFLDPNFAGTFLTLFLLFLLAHIEKIFNKDKSNIAKLGILAVLNIVAIFLTYSRSAIIMLIVGVGSYLILINKKKYLLVLIGTMFLAFLLLYPTFNKENTNLFRTTSSFARLETYSNALKIISDRPFVGVGFNAYRYSQESYGFRPVESRFPDHAEAGVDSSLLFVTATTGFIGLAAYLYVWYSIIKKSYQKRNKNRLFPSVVISSTIGLFINSLFINSLFYPTIMLWMWVVVGLMDREK